jgi:hypothetical protein
VDRGVVQPVRTQRIDVIALDGRGLTRQLDREGAERAKAWILRKVAANGGVDELVWGALGTEVVGVRLDSVVAVVRPRDDHGEELTLDPAQPGPSVHRLAV